MRVGRREDSGEGGSVQITVLVYTIHVPREQRAARAVLTGSWAAALRASLLDSNGTSLPICGNLARLT